MAENVVLSVQLSGAEAALAQLTQLDNVLKSVKSNRNVKISVNARSLNTAANSAKQLNDNLDNVTKSSKKIGTDGAKSIDNAGESLKKGSRNAESFNTGLGNVVLTMAKFRLASSAINLVTNGFKEAFAEMKRVDTEMVTIRKVTGFTADEMERLSKNAYSLASKYGRTASEVMAGESVFARAGYTTQIEQLGELSLLLQNVGDLQADDAARFLIATDAAYKLGGSYDDLMAVVDGLNEITNRNATDMQKMTEGMTVAGSVFAESGESIETFAALLGTATAKTQRSGAEMARGLRTILMNLRQIRVSMDENGEPIYAENIAAASKALKDFAGISTMENGQLRKASDVLGELASVWGTLGENEKAAIAEAVAGKRQANVLMALMGDWPAFEKMMADYANGAGSALAENEIKLDSWDAKTKQLKSSWTELVNAIADTKLIKDTLDLVTNLLETATKIVTPNTPEEVTYDAMGTTKEDERFNNALYKGITPFQFDLTDALQAFETNFDPNELHHSLQRVILDGKEFYNTLLAMKDAGEKLNEPEQRYISSFEALQKGLENSQDALELYGYAAAASSMAAGASAEDAAETANTQVEQLIEKLNSLPRQIDISININQKYASAKGEIDTQWNGLVDWLGDMKFFASGVQSAPGGPALVNEKGPEMIAANGLAWIAGGGKPTVTMLPKGATVLTAEETKRATSGRRHVRIPAFAEGKGSASSRQDYFIGWNCPYCGNVNSESATKCVYCGFPRQYAGQTTQKTYSYNPISASDLVRNSTGTESVISGKTGAYYEKKICPVCGTPNPINAKRCIACGYIFTDAEAGTQNGSGSGYGYYGGGSGVSAPNFKALEDELAKLLKNLDAQAQLAENEEDYIKAMMVYGEAQAAIADLLEQYRANGYADDSDEVLRLANLGYDYAAKQLGGYDKLQQNLIDALNALTESTDDANELAERREAVEKAREALANAEKQRTVRVFNPVTGQWEWVANAADVTKAQENLKNAEEALRKEELSQAVKSIKNAKPEELGDMTLSPAILDALLNGSPEQQTAFLRALGAASGGADWLASSEAKTAWNQGNNIGTQYNLNGITLTEEQASSMTIKQLIATLQGLKIM